MRWWRGMRRCVFSLVMLCCFLFVEWKNEDFIQQNIRKVTVLFTLLPYSPPGNPTRFAPIPNPAPERAEAPIAGI